MATLYAAKGGNTNSDLYTVDPATGAMTSVGPIGFALTGLAFDPTDGTLYGSTSNQSPSHPRSLISVDPMTGAGTFIGPFGFGAGSPCADLCFDATGQLYGWIEGSDELATVDKTTGVATLVGASGIGLDTFGDGMDFRAGTLWACPTGGPNPPHTLGDYGTLWTVDPITGAATAIVAMTGWAPDDNPAVAAASFDNSGVFYAIFNRIGLSTWTLITIDTATGIVTSIGAMESKSDALAWTPLAANDFSIDLTPATLTICRGFDDTTTLSTIITAGAAQSLTLSSTGEPADVTVAFAANPINSGDSTIVTVTVGGGATPAAVTITIHAVGPDATHTADLTLTIPGPLNDAYLAFSGLPLHVAAPGVLGNDIDPTMASLNTGPANGSVVLHPDGSFAYTPDPGFIGADSFTYDGNCGTATVALTIAIAQAAGVFDGAPVAQAT